MAGSLRESQKTVLRATALARRDGLSDEQRAAAAQAIAGRRFPVEVAKGMIAAGYSAVRSEIDPLPLMRALAAHGAQLALPVIVARDVPLIFRAWNPGGELVRGQLGILEPPGAPEVVPDIVLVPLAAFDRAGHRVGYGAGYYDRTLPLLRRLRTITAIGLAFAVQEIPDIPADVHDARLDCVLTESGFLDFRS